MSQILLQTKLIQPAPRPFLISRPQLVNKLNTGLDRNVTLISAPAGFGKTTLVSAWLSETQLPVAWLSLDDADNEPARFLRYFVAALATVVAVDLILSELLQSETAAEPQFIFTHLLNALAAQPTQFIFVLEDFHVITNRVLLDGLTLLIDHAPHGLHLLITSRSDPALPLSRWRVRRRLNEVRAADLRFTHAETKVLLKQMNILLTDAQATGLNRRTEGWVAGLQLAGLSLQNQTDRDQFISNFTGSHRYIMEYLTDEVLSHQSPTIEAFLLQTSILDRFCAPLCDALYTEDADATMPIDSRTLIAQLESANLFLVALDEERTWYRYHHLFADLLRERAKQKLPAAQISTLHRRAADWLATHDFVDEALAHATVGGEWQAVADAIRRLAIPLFYQGRSKRVARWLAALPDAVVVGEPRLHLKRAWLLLINLDWQGVGRYVATAIFPTADPVYVAKAANIRAWYAIITGDVADGMAIARAALAELGTAFPAEQGELRTTLSQGHFALDNFDAGVEALTQALVDLERGEQWAGLSGATAFLMRRYLQHGRLRMARRIGEQFVHRFGDRPLMQIGGGLQATAFYALTLYESGVGAELAEAERLATRTLELAELSMPNAEMGIWMRLFLALVKQTRQDAAAASTLAAEAAAQLRLLPPHIALVDHYDLQIRYELLADHNDDALAWIESVAALDLTPEHPAQIRNQIRRAQAVLQTTPTDQTALAAARRQLSEIVKLSLPDFTLMKAQALLALVADAADDQAAALAALEQALILAAPEQWIQMFAYPGQRMIALLAQSRKTSAVPEFCATVEMTLRMIATADGRTADPALSHPAASNMVPGLLEPLTARELEVLHLLAQGYSNREIASRLVIAAGTTKRHLGNIYGKLAVSNRTEAANRARELGLLAD